MGYRYDEAADKESGKYFRAFEISGSMMIAGNGKIPFYQVLLVNNDMETLFFVEQNMSRLINNAIILKQMNKPAGNRDEESRTFTRGVESLLESIIMKKETDVLQNLTGSIKKAILSIALDRYNGNKEMICSLLGLSSSQLDDEMRSSGFALLTNKER